MDSLPPLLQAFCIYLDCQLITRLPRSMARNYLIFSLVRSFVRAGVQWFYPNEWPRVYWWGEGVGYIVVILLALGLVAHLLEKHINTATFYTLAGLTVTVIALWRLPHPLTFPALLAAGNVARGATLFILFIALVLGEKWENLTRWMAWGLILNLGCQIVGGWFELRLGPTLGISLIHQLGFLILQLSWLVGINITRSRRLLTFAELADGL